MRIVVVSAHYPPNFVSGGTVQPQRLARGLRARGHDVSVYAGWLGPRPPLDAWAEDDDTGLPVRWVATTPWTGWSDDRNWDNPPVTADFARWLAEARPDVVHLHSLQTLGAGLVTAAAASGARVVVTMHDFWWSCARQFLVDRTLVPCSPVVDAGVCACAVDHAWLQRRNAALREHLAAADLVLCPSVSAAAVMAANGVDPQRLRVDENGLPGDVVVRRAPKGEDGAVRFVYAGGPNPLKGVHVMLGAAAALTAGAVTGWTLTTYGAGQDHPERRGADRGEHRSAGRGAGRGVHPGPVTFEPAFDPADAGAVFARADVVVVPSVMRESHSLLTREALGRGVPVVVTDSLGPEEVVVPDLNGLVVPAGDTLALAAAMRRVVEEPGLLDRLRRGCRDHPVTIRSLPDQVAGLEAVLADLVDSGPPRSLARVETVRRVVFMVGITGAPLRYRAHLPAEALALLGIHSDVRAYRDPELPALIDAADVLCVYRVPATVQVLALIERAQGRGTPVLFDVDDLIFDPDLAAEIPALGLLPPAEAELWLEGVRRYRTTMERCDGFVGSTAGLVEHAATVTALPTARFDNGVGLVLARLSDAARLRPTGTDRLLIGYLSGTTTHDHDWSFVEPAVIDVLDRHPDTSLLLGGYLPDSPALARFGDRVRRVGFRPWFELPDLLADLAVNLAPLAPGSRFNEAKSAIKWLEAALVQTPTIASPTTPYREAITHGVNGMLASTPAEWVAALDELVDPGVGGTARRRRLGARARRDALLHWSPHLQGRRYLAILEEAFEWRERARSRPRRGAGWAPVVHDEPPQPCPLEPYAGAGAVVALVPAPPAALRPEPTLTAKFRHSLHERGLAATAKASLAAVLAGVTRTAGRRRDGQ